MSSWAERVHRRAADLGSVVTSCGHPATAAYPYRLEKVKFGVPLDEVCKNNNIPGPLLVLILKLNKESPNRRDVFRAPGHQGAMKKLIHFLQSGRLVNVDNYSVYTIASVLKKFLRKIPNGIFGRSGENELFAIIELKNETEQQERIHRLLTSLPKYTQHLLVLLFGTFRVIASNATHANTGMTSEALGVSVAPSFFQSCVSDGKTARMEDVLKFKVATKIMKHIIDKFAVLDLFGRGNYEYYARVTGRILKVQDEWICSFQYPPPPRGKLAQQKYALQHSLEAEKTWLQCQCERWGLIAQEESRSTPALLTSSSSALENSVLSLGVAPEHSFMESCARLSVSLEGPGLFALTSSPMPAKHTSDIVIVDVDDDDDDDNKDDGDDDDDDNDNDEDDDGNATNDEGYNKDEEQEELPIEVSDIENKPNNNDVSKMTTTVQRRYRRNIQKTTNTHRQLHHHHHHHNHNRSKVKTKEVASDSDCISPPIKQISHKTTKLTSSSVGGLTAAAMAAATSTTTTTTTARLSTCNRCQRGIRHSSSCSSTRSSKSASGEATSSNSHMTMDELRAVNRYAESTKSLSYLPQVHERQTARMRTRSEWFLGPKGSISMDIKACSNCYLLHHNHHLLHHDDEFLVGGSTNDVKAAATARTNEMYLMFKGRQSQEFQQQQQQQQQKYQHNYHRHQQQHHHHMENMDTDEYGDYGENSAFNFLSLDSTMLRGVSTSTGEATTPTIDCSNSSTASRIFMETNFSTISAGNIRLSNSAESVQYPFRRLSRRALVGTTRHHPHRSSLRRNKTKNAGNSNGNGGGGGGGSSSNENGNISCSNRNQSTTTSAGGINNSKSGVILSPTTKLCYQSAAMYAQDECDEFGMDTSEDLKINQTQTIAANRSAQPSCLSGLISDMITTTIATVTTTTIITTTTTTTMSFFKPPRV